MNQAEFHSDFWDYIAFKSGPGKIQEVMQMISICIFPPSAFQDHATEWAYDQNYFLLLVIFKTTDAWQTMQQLEQFISN